ncbi:MAG: PAS domain S-box protein [Methanospirillum sp.]
MKSRFPVTGQPAPAGGTRPTSILYVDDEPALLSLTKVFLERQGLFSVDTAESASVALERIATCPYDAIVSDYQMPGMDGIEFLRALRAAGNTTPFIIFTGRGREEVVIEAIDSGADFYVQKGGNPVVQFAELAHKINQAIGRRTAENALRESEDRCRTLLRHVSDVITVIDSTGTMVYDTGSSEHILGYPAGYALGRNAFEFIHPDDHELARTELEAVVRGTRNDAPIEYRVRKGDGSYIWVESIGANCSETPGINGLVITFRPIEGRRRAEQEIRDSDRKFREIFDNTTYPLAIHELGDGWIPRRFIDINDAGCRMLGYSREELLERGPADFETGGIDPPPERVGEMLETTGCATLRTGLRRRDGVVVPVEIVAHVIDLADRRVVLSAFLDINRRNDEERMLRAQHALGTALRDARDLPAALDACLSAAIEISGLDSGGIYLVDPATGALDLAASRNLGDPFIAAASHYAADSPHVRMVIAGVPFLVPNRPTELIPEEIRDQERLRAFFVVPILADGAAIACLVSSSHLSDEIAPEAQLALEAISTHVAEAIVRLQAESALRVSEERFKAIFAGQETGILIIDPSEHRIVDANPYLCTLIGLSREAIVDHVCRTFVCPAELGACPITDLHQRIDRSDRVLIDGGGRKIPILKTVSRVRFGDREYLVESIQDITEQKESERALRESEERYRALFAAESDGIFVIDRETGTIVDCNEAVTGMYGYRKEELVGMSNMALAAEQEVPWETMHGPGEIPIRRHRRKDGTVLQIELTANEVSFRGRDLIIAAARDISDRRRMEEALATANRRLSLMNNITRHDINNQIAVIRGYITLLDRERPEPPLDEYLRGIGSAAERIDAIIRFTRTIGTLGEHAPAWQELRTIVETAVRNASTDRIAIEHTLPAGVEVFADPLIEKVVFNLIDNAVRHGGAITTVRFSAERRHGGDLVLICEDDGDGVPAAEKERIFERGFGKNTGLGLFLAREILGITGITIRETGERGARFEITVPADGVRRHEDPLVTLAQAEGQGALTPES